MRLLLDINVVLDVLLNKASHFAPAATVWAAVENKQAEGYLSAHAITTPHYLLTKDSGSQRANRYIKSLLKVFRVAPVDQAVIEDACALGFADFEDAVTASAARFAACKLIVTRDPRGFRNSPVPCLPPAAILPLL